MARESKQDRISRVHSEALTEFNDISTALWNERQLNREDRRFAIIPGAMYEGPLGEMFANRPRMEINKILKAGVRITSEYRNNQMDVRFESKDGTDAGKLAITCEGLYRADEANSGAQEAFLNAFDEALYGGFGAVRLRNVMEDELDPENENQRILIEPIVDADISVYFDLDAKRQDKRDATRCFVIYSMTRAAYKAKYGIDPSSWPRNTQANTFNWVEGDFVYLAEYYRVEISKETVREYTLFGGMTREIIVEDTDDDEIVTLEATSDPALTTERKRKTRVVHKYLMDGQRIIEDYGIIAGKNIPIVPVYGIRAFIDGIERCQGIVRVAKDPARLKNMQVSRLAEIASLSVYEKPIFTPQQMAGHELGWSRDNIDNNSVMYVNPTFDAQGNPMPVGPIGYTKPPSLPPALAAILQATEIDLQDILGSNQSQEKMVSNISGKAVELIQQRIDQGAYLYIQNMSQAIRRCGEIWLGMACDVYVDRERKMKTLDQTGKASFVDMSEKEMINGKMEYAHDISRAKLDVVVSAGPATSSKRQTTVRDLLSLIAITEDPTEKKNLMAMAMQNMEGEGIEDMRDYYRKYLVMSGIIKPTEEEQKEMAQAQQEQAKPDPQAEYLLANAQKALADAERSKADAAKTMQELSPEAQIIKQQMEREKAAMELQQKQEEIDFQLGQQGFEREKIRLDIERQVLELQARRIELEHQLQIEAMKAQAQIENRPKAVDNSALESVNAQIAALADKLGGDRTQPIVIQSGGSKFEIVRTPKGYAGSVKPE
jgi:hypothetical protein